MFYVEQGLAQTIEVFDSSDHLQAFVLVDFGTDRGVRSYASLKAQDKAIGKSCASLEEKIASRGKIDILVISHTDNDHISLLVKFLQLNSVVIDQVILGGTPRGRHSLAQFTANTVGKYRTSRVLKDLGGQLAKVCPDPANQVKMFASMNHYCIQKGARIEPKTTGAASLGTWSFGASQTRNPQALLRVVTSRHFIDDEKLSGDAAAYINANSVVLAMEIYADQSDGVPASVIFLTGDIQWTTMKQLTDWFEMGGERCFPFLSAGVHRAMIVPHHGALKTACKGNNIAKDDGNNPLEVQLEDLKKWGEKMGCEILAVSAKQKKSRPHPCQQTMEQLRTSHLRTNLPLHQNVEMSAALIRNKATCRYTETVEAVEQGAVYTSYAGQMTAPGRTQAVETARDVIISVDDEGKMDVSAQEREGA